MDEPLLPTDPKARKAAMGGVLLIALGGALTYYFALRPLLELRRTGHTAYYLKGVLTGPLVAYVGVLALTGRFGDGEIRTANAAGKSTLTRKGWIVIAGAILVATLTLAAWFGYLHSLGLQATES